MAPRFQSPGAAAGNAIQQLLIERAMQQRQALIDQFTQQQAQSNEEMRRQELGLRERQFGADEEQRRLENERQAEETQRAAQERETATRAQQNQIGVRDMIATRLGEGPLNPQDAQTIAGMGYREGMPVPGIVDQALKPKPVRPPVELNEGAILVDPETGKEIARGNPKRDTQAGQEPLVAIMGPDGQSVLVPRSQAAGKQPANTREQGRPVMSSDANRIAELDSSLSDLDKLEVTLSAPEGEKATGAAAKIGAALPNVVTEFTGWGADAKSRQGTINRVKQVIGRALEGGVLRKEDEIKYKEILPTIDDPPDVAATKLKGLKAAITQKRQQLLEALSDANFDTSKFNARTPAGGSPAGGAQEYDYIPGKGLVPRGR